MLGSPGASETSFLISYNYPILPARLHLSNVADIRPGVERYSLSYHQTAHSYIRSKCHDAPIFQEEKEERFAAGGSEKPWCNRGTFRSRDSTIVRPETCRAGYKKNPQSCFHFHQ